jgi:hypothetical protein
MLASVSKQYLGISMKMIKQWLLKLTIASTALLVAACGGGAGGTGSSASTASSSSSSTVPSLTLSVQTTAGVSTHSITAGDTTKVTALFKSAGLPLANALVTFTITSSTLATLSPASGTAITDASGLASIDLSAVAPNPGGAFSVQASAVSGTVTATATDWVMSVGAATVVISSAVHSPVSSAASPVQTGSSVTITANVTSAGNPVSSGVSFTASSACLTQGKAVFTAIGVLNGVFTGSYKNAGCSASPDVVTLSQVGGSASTQLSIYTAGSTLAELRFTSVNPVASSLVIKGGGGYGRVETGSIVFQVLDNVQQPIQGVTVAFGLSSIAGGLKLVSYSGITDQLGNVTATVQSGTVPTPFVVSATTTYAGTTLSASSSVINISVGLPEEKSMSLSSTANNIEGWDYDGITSTITVRLADFWGNKVADGTTVNMITEGGVVGLSTGAACNTSNGACSLDLSSQNFRPANGRVSVTAYTQGPLSFNDLSGVGDFTAAGTTCYHSGDPFIDFDENGAYTASASALIANRTSTNIRSTESIVSGNLGISVPSITNGYNILYSNFAETYVPYTGGAYTPPTFSLACGTVRPLRYISKKAVIVFSGSNVFGASEAVAPTLTWPLNQTVSYNGAVESVGCGTTAFNVRAYDLNFNALPAGTAISVSASSTLGSAKISGTTILSTSGIGGTTHTIEVDGKCDPAVAPLTGYIVPVGRSGYVDVIATTPKGIKSSFRVITVY